MLEETGTALSGTHQVDLLTRWPVCRTSCWAAAPTRRSGLPPWRCSWCWGGGWPPSPSSPSGPPAVARSPHSLRSARSAWPRTCGTPRCTSGRPCRLCRTVRPTPGSAWTASGCRPGLEAEMGALQTKRRKRRKATLVNVLEDLLYC